MNVKVDVQVLVLLVAFAQELTYRRFYAELVFTWQFVRETWCPVRSTGVLIVWHLVFRIERQRIPWAGKI